MLFYSRFPNQLLFPIVQFCLLFNAGLSQIAFDLTILHTNDVHSRYCQTDVNGGICTQDLANSGMCYGGYARKVTKINEVRESHDNVLLLDSGEALYGIRAWYETYGGLAASYFMNRLGYNATGLGRQDFTRGIDGLLPFLSNNNFPLVLSNVDSSQEPRMEGLYVPEHVLTFDNGEQVGIVGYIGESVPDYKSVGNLVIDEIIPSVQAAVDRLVSSGINKIIALGHAGISDHERVARMVRGIDVIVAGTNPPSIFLWNGAQPSVDIIDGPYPLVVNPDHDQSETVLIVTAYPNGKYLGYLNVGFNRRGEVRTFDGNPIFLNDSCPEDPDALAEINQRKLAVEDIEDEIVGESCVDLYGLIDQCGVGECNVGNLIADCMVWEWNKCNCSSADGWADVTMAILNVGSFYGFLDVGPITFGNIKELIPWGDTYDLATLKGRHIVDALEQGVSLTVYVNDSNWAFLYVSGMRIIYDMTKPIGSRVQDVQVLCLECDIPEYVPIEADKEYKIVINSYIAGGGDGQNMTRDNIIDQQKGRLDTDILRDCIAELGVVKTGLDNRFVVFDSENLPPCPFPMRSGQKLRKRP